MTDLGIPDWMMHPLKEFGVEYREEMARGEEILSRSRIAVTGLARDCDGPLLGNLNRAAGFFDMAKDWRLHIRENDSKDGTKAVLADFCGRHPRASFYTADYGRERLANAFAGPRTAALADYRQACARWVAEQEVDYVVVIDWDAWGGWSMGGALTGFSRLESVGDAFGMASVSLLQHSTLTLNKDNQVTAAPQWSHYDCWALRLNCYLDDYSVGCGGWKHGWLPFVGSPPVPVCSAFGGLCIYRAEDFAQGTYDGSDCEHVTFHASIANKTGKRLYLNPSQRTVMQWMPEVATDGAEAGGQHSPVSG